MPELVTTDEEIMCCFDVMVQLRTHLNKSEFLSTVRAMQREGFQLASITESGRVVTVAGFRLYTNLFMGRHLYVDDLVSDQTVRSKGHGKEMIAFLKTIAINEKCQYFHLDSGTHRHDAHRFYLNQGFDIASYHFSQRIGTD